MGKTWEEWGRQISNMVESDFRIFEVVRLPEGENQSNLSHFERKKATVEDRLHVN